MSNKMQGKPKLCPLCEGQRKVTAPRIGILRNLLGAARIPCPRCHMRGWVPETEIDCVAEDGRW